MHSVLVSELAGLGAALFWGLAAICWGELSRKAHSTVVATMRLVLAVAALGAIHFARHGTLWPTDLPPAALGMLAFSGVVASGLGDVLYFHAIQRIGPRLTLTILTLSPVGATLLARLPPLHETMSPQQIGGMALAVAGVTWVVAEKSGRQSWPSTPGSFRRGVALAVASVVCQAIGFLSSRLGLIACSAAPVPPFSAALVRVTSACLCCLGLLAVQGRMRETVRVVQTRATLGWLLLGVATGPVIGIWFSMVALQGAPTGVASTLVSLSPLFMIPMSWMAYGERPTLDRTVATLVALGGVACMMLA